MPFYTRANAGEVLADPASPLGWTLVFEKGLLPGWLRGLVEFGIYREGELPMERPPVAGLFGGYFYINLSHCRVVAIRMGMTVEAFDAALLGSAAAAPPYQPHPDDPCERVLGQGRADDRRDPRRVAVPADRRRPGTRPRQAARPPGPRRAVRGRPGRARPLVPARAGQRVRPARLLHVRLRGRARDARRGVRRGRPARGPARPHLGLRRGAVRVAVVGPVAAVPAGQRLARVRRGLRRLPGRVRPARPQRVGHPRRLLGGGAGPGARAGRQHAAHPRRGFAGRPARPAGSHPPGRHRPDPRRPARRREPAELRRRPGCPRPGPSRCARRPS